MAFMHHCILGVDVGDRQLHDAKQSGGGRIFLRPCFVSDDVHGVHREAIVGAVGQFGVDVLLLARQEENGTCSQTTSCRSARR